jgi:DNA-binding CsgD family transcriptional regulator
MEPVADLGAQLTHLAGRTAYLDAASELLLKMFPADSVARIVVDTEGGMADAHARYAENRPPGATEGWHELWDDHPILLSCLKDTTTGMWQPRRLSDLVSDRELHATRAYQIGLRVLGSNRQLSFLTVRHGRANIQGWSLNRSGHDFSDAEVDLSAHVQPILRLLDIAYDGSGPDATEKDAAAAYSLTAREHEVLDLAGQGLTATAMGHLLGISPRTIGKHLEHAYVNLGSNNRIDALRRLNGR